MANDMVNHPKHYAPKFSRKPVECIDVTEHLPFALGNAFKYVWRAGDKGDYKKAMEDLDKACWYLERAVNNSLSNIGIDKAREIFDSLERDRSARFYILSDLLQPTEDLIDDVRVYGAAHLIKRDSFIKELYELTAGREACGESVDWQLLNKMEEVLKLYPGNEWQTKVMLTTDEEHEMVPVSSVSFGRWHNGESGEWNFLTLILDEHGNQLPNVGPLSEVYYECSDSSLETPAEVLIEQICNEILKRKKNERKDEDAQRDNA